MFSSCNVFINFITHNSNKYKFEKLIIKYDIIHDKYDTCIKYILKYDKLELFNLCSGEIKHTKNKYLMKYFPINIIKLLVYEYFVGLHAKYKYKYYKQNAKYVLKIICSKNNEQMFQYFEDNILYNIIMVVRVIAQYSNEHYITKYVINNFGNNLKLDWLYINFDLYLYKRDLNILKLFEMDTYDSTIILIKKLYRNRQKQKNDIVNITNYIVYYNDVIDFNNEDLMEELKLLV